MDRKTFIKAGCLLCTSFGFTAALLQSCAPVKYVNGIMTENGMLVDKQEFAGGKTQGTSYAIVRHEDLLFPICIFRIDDQTYSALLMRCTHQGAELQVAGDQLRCPAHGSAFDLWGKVTQSPAAADLRSFPVTIQDNHIFIDLRKQG